MVSEFLSASRVACGRAPYAGELRLVPVGSCSTVLQAPPEVGGMRVVTVWEACLPHLMFPCDILFLDFVPTISDRHIVEGGPADSAPCR